MTNELTVIPNAGVLMTQATDVAGVCRDIVSRTAQNIQGRKYVKVEGWQSIAAAYGCVASSKDVEKVEGGIRAIGVLHRISDGAQLATAEGFLGDDEQMWAKRPEYARRAMAQTRAISRVCRSAFAFVVVMIDGNLSTTPAEEMTYEHEEKPAGSGDASASTPLPPATGAASGKVETRTEVLRRLCAEAKVTVPDMCAKAGCTSAEEFSEEDWSSAMRFLNKKIASMKKAA